MNKRRKLAKALALAVVLVTLVSGVGYASISKDFKYKNVDAYVHGYVDFESYFLGGVTKVWCNVSLGGADRDAVSAKYTLRTDKKIIAKDKNLNCKKQSASYDGVSGGIGATYGRLLVTYDGKTKTLTDR